MNLAKHFPNANWLKTKAGAEQRIAKALSGWDTQMKSEPFTWVIVDRTKVDPHAKPTGKPGWMTKTEYLPIALLSERNSHYAMYLIDKGIAVFKP